MRYYQIVLPFVAILSLAGAAHATPVTIEFDGPYDPLPFSEDGLTFTALSGRVYAGGTTDGYLAGGTNTIPIRVRVTGIANFDLLSLDVENYFRTWTIESSSGAVFDVLSEGTLDFESESGWRNLSYFEIVHDPGEPNGAIRIDNVSVQFVPEPSTAMCGLLAAISLQFFTRPGRMRR